MKYKYHYICHYRFKLRKNIKIYVIIMTSKINITLYLFEKIDQKKVSARYLCTVDIALFN